MKVLLHTLILSTLVAFGAKGQNPVYRYSLGLGFERVGLDGPDAIGNRYLVGYARHFRNDRLVLIGNVGYINAPNRRYLPLTNNVYATGKRRERLTSDATLAFDFISHSSHAFRLGVGPSLWYRQDELMGPSHYTVLSDGSVTNAQIKWVCVKELNYGFNVLVEYEYAFTERLLASAKLKFASLERAGQSSMYAVGLGYRLP